MTLYQFAQPVNPLQQRMPLAAWVRVVALFIAGAVLAGGGWLWNFIISSFGAEESSLSAAIAPHINVMTWTLFLLCLAGAAGVLLLSTLMASMLKRPAGHRVQHLAFCLAHILIVICLMTMISLASSAADGFEDGADRFFTIVQPWGLIIMVAWIMLSWAHISHWRLVSLQAYQVQIEDNEGPGDRFIEQIRTFGGDREYQHAWLRLVGIFLLILILPLLMPSGCMRYAIPPGAGQPAAPAAMVQEVVEEEEEEFILAEDSQVIFERPDPTESEVVQQMLQQTEQVYDTAADGAPGAIGEGNGTEGGWPDGNEGPVMFVRIKHKGFKWNDGMDAKTGNADLNFMTWLERQINLPHVKTDKKGKAFTISQLYNSFEEGYRPPFVYLTGDRGFSFSGKERKTLRKLLLEGTLLFADAGSPDFHASFVREMRSVFSDKSLVSINDEDPIMRIPKRFTHGLKSNQWHGPSQAMGIKHQKRWIVFYHPGDANDMWKDDAVHVEDSVRYNAFDIGYNIVWYSFTRYLEVNREVRK